MAEPGIKREARRKRILENLDDRLNKITGKNCIKDKNFEIQDSFKPDEQFQHSFGFQNLNYKNFAQDKKCNDYNINVDSTFSPVNYTCKIFQYLFVSSLSYIFLAAFMNILLVHVDFYKYKGIITPYTIMTIMHLFIGNKLKEFHDSSILIAILILCNIKPEILHNVKRIVILCSTALKNFALYLTSFIFFNWITSVWYHDINQIKFI